MIENFDVAMQNVFKSEGGYANDPRDPGGETKFIVTPIIKEPVKRTPVKTTARKTVKRIKK